METDHNNQTSVSQLRLYSQGDSLTVNPWEPLQIRGREGEGNYSSVVTPKLGENALINYTLEFRLLGEDRTN